MLGATQVPEVSEPMALTRLWRERRFSVMETFFVSCLVGGLVLVTSGLLHVPKEAKPLRTIYGPERQSEHVEEWIVRDFFNDKRGGFFVDVGANHYKRFSNIYYLETELGWSGLAIEPLLQFEAEYVQYRPRTRFLPFFVSDESDAEAKMFLVKWNPLVTSADKSFTQRWGRNVTELTAPTSTLDDLLDSEDVSTIDFLSMDIELSEPAALAGFDVEHFRPELVCIEAHPAVRQQIIDYFTTHGYAIVGAYLRADTHNLYFAPFSPSEPGVSKPKLPARKPRAAFSSPSLNPANPLASSDR